jgi:hypothetical protein
MDPGRGDQPYVGPLLRPPGAEANQRVLDGYARQQLLNNRSATGHAFAPAPTRPLRPSRIQGVICPSRAGFTTRTRGGRYGIRLHQSLARR